MQRHFAPVTMIAGVLVLSLLITGFCVRLAVDQPWLGVDLQPRDGFVVIRAADSRGPLGDMTGAILLAVGQTGGDLIRLDPDDIVEEPDTLGDGARMARFFERQNRLHDVLRQENVTVVLQQDGRDETREVRPAATRPTADLRWQFWTQNFVAVVGLLLGAWVVAMRQRDLAAWMLFLAGVGLALAAQSAAIYSTRELALGMPVLGIASRINGTGTLLFGIGMVTLFLVYPRRLVRGWFLTLPAIVIGAMTGFMVLVDWPHNVSWLQLFVALVMAVLLAAILAQVWATRHDPAARAMMGWLGLSVAIGAGGFVLTAIIPYLLERPPIVAQSTAFLFFLIIYAGVALGVARYRLFDLADWSLGILSYAIGVGLLLAFDAFLVIGLSLERLPALSLSLALVCLTYLPLRERIAARFRSTPLLSIEDVYRRITAIANTSGDAAQFAQIETLWHDLFRPSSLGPIGPNDALCRDLVAPRLAENGRIMLLPGLAGFPALRLDFANKGARLFSSRDLRQAQTIGQLLDDTVTRHRNYIDGIATERSRINRDMHDNIGILLLSALHSPEVARKNTLIRQTLSDLREIVANKMQAPWSLHHLLADLRAEIAEVLAAAGVTLDWQEGEMPDTDVPPQTVLTLRSLLREATSNILRHAGARNLRTRLSQSDAGLDITSSGSGTVVSATIPLSASLGDVAA